MALPESCQLHKGLCHSTWPDAASTLALELVPLVRTNTVGYQCQNAMNAPSDFTRCLALGVTKPRVSQQEHSQSLPAAMRIMQRGHFPTSLLPTQPAWQLFGGTTTSCMTPSVAQVVQRTQNRMPGYGGWQHDARAIETESGSNDERTPVKNRKRKQPDLEVTPNSVGSDDESTAANTSEATTPQVLKKLKSIITMEDGTLGSPRTTAVRIMQWAQEAQARIGTGSAQAHKQRASPSVPEAVAQPARVYKFQKHEASQAAEAVQAFQKLLSGIKAQKGQQKIQIEATFRDPVEKAADLAERVKLLNGPAGPTIPVQFLSERDGLKWVEPKKHSWFATTKGDDRLFVCSVNIPGVEGKKGSKISLQLRARSKELRIFSERKILLDYATNLIMLFGKVETANLCKAQGVPELASFWQ